MKLKSIKNNSGQSLVETMIYMVLSVLVIGYALNSMTQISRGYVKSRTVMKMQKDGRDAVQTMGREMGNMGYKYYLWDTTMAITPATGSAESKQIVKVRPSGSEFKITTDHSSSPEIEVTFVNDRLWLEATYLGKLNTGDATTAPDSSASFIFTPAGTGEFGDELTFYRARIARNSAGSGKVGSVEQIRYYLSNDTLFRDELIADSSALWVPTASPSTDFAAVWGGAITTIAFAENVKALQFQFSENGRDWVDDPTGKRNLMKLLKIQLLVKSSRAFDAKYDVEYSVGDLTPSDLKEDGVLFRLYEKIIEIPNNGILN